MYFRKVTSPENDLIVDDFPIFRFICLRRGIALNCEHKTFSILPIGLMPYCKFSVIFIINALLIMFNSNTSLNKTVDLIEKKYSDIVAKHDVFLKDILIYYVFYYIV